MKKRNKVLVAIANLSMWINDHFYYYLEGDEITSQVTIAFIKSKEYLRRKTKEVM